MKVVKAFGIPRFAGEGKQRPAPQCVGDINKKLEQLGIDADAIVNIQADTEFYHVFYKADK